MNSRLVSTCIAIIRLLPSTGLNVNKIIKQTSSDREHVIEAISTLREGRLITQELSNSHKQMKIVTPTDLGNEIKSLMSEYDGFAHSLSEFEKKLNNFGKYSRDSREETIARNYTQDPYDQFVSKDKLLNDGWSKDDIKLFMNLTSGLWFMEDMCKRNIFLILFHRYTRVLYRHSLNGIAKSILIILVLSLIRHQLDKSLGGSIEQNFRKKLDPDAKDMILHDLLGLCEPLEADLKRLYLGNYYLFRSRFTAPEVINLVTSMLPIGSTRQVSDPRYHQTNSTRIQTV